VNTRVLLAWLTPGSLDRNTQWHWMPVPAIGHTVHIPLPTEEEPLTTLALEVQQVSWTCDNTPFWHAEVRLG
jgi:hypothetical protein